MRPERTKILALLLFFLALSWLGFSRLLGNSSLGVDWGQMAVPFLSLLVQTLVYAALALVLSMFLPTRSLAATVSHLKHLLLVRDLRRLAGD